jgi:hypothetical protein
LLNNRQSSNRRRGRGRSPQSGGPRGNESRIDNRARSNAPQMLEKFKNLAREAQMQGDRVMTEYYLQFSDHYFRIVAESRARTEETRARRDEWQGEEGGEGASEGGASGYDQMGESLDDEAGPIDGDNERPERNERPRRDGNRDGNRENNRDRSERPERAERTERAARPERSERAERTSRAEPNDRPERTERAERPERVSRTRVTRPAPASDFDPDAGSISIDILPPALGVVSDPIQDLDEAPATPRRRVARPRKAAAVETEG